jgi:cytochrome P450
MKVVPKRKESTVGIVRSILKYGLLEDVTRKFRELGDIWDMKMVSIYFSSHPIIAKHIFHDKADNYFAKNFPGSEFTNEFLGNGLSTTSDYALWKKERSTAEPCFYLPRFKEYTPQLVHNTLEMLAHFETAAQSKTPLNIGWCMAELSVHNLVKTIFNNINFDFKAFNHASHIILEEITNRSNSPFKFMWHLPTERKRLWHSTLKQLNDIVYKVIHERLKEQEWGDDLLGRYLKASANVINQEATLKQIRDEVMVFFFAGHETTADTLSWTCLMLSKHPEVERKARHEIETVLNGRLVTYDDLKLLPYTRAILSETLRINPVIPQCSPRTAAEDDEIMGHFIPKGVSIMASIYHVHRHPDYWSNPEGFEPERFIKNPWHQHQQFAFIPGIAGERHCIGIHFAMLEAHIALVTILQRFRVMVIPGADLTPIIKSASLRPKDGFEMLVERIR